MSVTIIDKPKVDIAPDLLHELMTKSEEMGQVVLHFLYSSGFWGSRIRIWPTTYLYDQHSEHRSDLVHTDEITMFPTWTDVEPLQQHYFSLIFSGLPKSCVIFDFIEECNNQGNEFQVKNILRNNSDIYFFRMS